VVVGDHQGDVVVVSDSRQHLDKLGDPCGIELCAWFIEQQYTRCPRDEPRERNPLTLTPG